MNEALWVEVGGDDAGGRARAAVLLGSFAWYCCVMFAQEGSHYIRVFFDSKLTAYRPRDLLRAIPFQEITSVAALRLKTLREFPLFFIVS